MLYADYLSTAEGQRWILDYDIPWDQIDRQTALTQPDLLERVRDSALIESFFPIFTPRALDVLWDDVNATAIFSIQLYESYKHYQVFNQYLECIDYRPVTEVEIVEVRRKNFGLEYECGTRLLTRYMMSEHFAAYHFLKDAKHCHEPVLKHILNLVGRDEIRHTQFAYDLLADRIKRDPAHAEKVLEGAAEFQHLGLLVVDEVPVAQKNDFAAIVTINQKIKRLTGKGIGNAKWEKDYVATA